MSARRHERGVALITALLIVALAVILATQIGFEGALEQRRTITAFSLDQAVQIGAGAEAWAAHFLQEDHRSDAGKNPPQDHLAEDWARPMPPIPIDGGQIEGGLEDLQGRFNLNNLLADTEEDRRWHRSFEHLLAALELEPKWASVLGDWLDADPQANFPDGAEDETYTALTPPYRAANGPIMTVSELLALPDFGLERYRKLRPYVTALPIGTPVNVCTAPGVVLDALTEEGIEEYGLRPEEVARDRKNKCFPQVDTLLRVHPTLDGMITQQTQYFRLSAWITIGDMEFSLYSLLYRNAGDATGRVRTLMRSFGAE